MKTQSKKSDYLREYQVIMWRIWSVTTSEQRKQFDVCYNQSLYEATPKTTQSFSPALHLFHPFVPFWTACLRSHDFSELLNVSVLDLKPAPTTGSPSRTHYYIALNVERKRSSERSSSFCWYQNTIRLFTLWILVRNRGRNCSDEAERESIRTLCCCVCRRSMCIKIQERKIFAI